MHVMKSPHGSGFTGTPGIAEEDKLPHHASPDLSKCEDTQLESVGAHRGRGRTEDPYGGSVEVQALWFEVGLPAGGGRLLREGDRYYHVLGS